MRALAAAFLAIGVLGLVPAATGAVDRSSVVGLRLLYTSDWSGPLAGVFRRPERRRRDGSTHVWALLRLRPADPVP